MKQLLVIVLVIIIVFPLAAYGWYSYQLQPVSRAVKRTYVNVEEGMSARDIASALHDKGLIRNPWVFYTYMAVNEYANSLQAGFYQLSPTQPVAAIAATLTEGQVENHQVRIPSGVELGEIKRILTEAGYREQEVEQALAAEYEVDILQYKPSDHDLEGYLFPDTYIIANNGDVQTLVEMIVSHLDQEVTDELKAGWREQGLSVHEGLTLASIVQKEVSDPQERAQVAQVFLSRLEQGMPLEADPTFMYAARQQGIEEASIEIDSPYNTYQAEGLPPGPISTVEAGALQAVAEPADTDYLFFVTGDDGVTRFSKTKEEHEQKIQQHGVSGT